jgi:hypothetical protein
MIESLGFRTEKWGFCIYKEESQESLGGDILEIPAFCHPDEGRICF